MTEFTLPDLGEGLEDARIVEWFVMSGQNVSMGANMVSVETAKAIVDIPAPFDCYIDEVCAEVDDIVNVGDVLVVLRVSDSTGSDSSQKKLKSESTSNSQNSELADEKEKDTVSAHDNRANIGIVGSVECAPSSPPSDNNLITKRQKDLPMGGMVDADHESTLVSKNIDHDLKIVKALPAVRVKANQLGLDLHTIDGTGPDDSVTFSDIEATVQTKIATDSNIQQQQGDNYFSQRDSKPLITKQKSALISAQQEQVIRRRMSDVMRASQIQVVPATVNELADIHHLPVDVDLTALALQATVYAISYEPVLNAWFDHESATLDQNDSVNIGFAVDTPLGLLTPVLQDADQLNNKGIRKTLDTLINRARSGSLTPAQMTGATITLSNFGSIFGMYANLVIPPPTVAIVGIGHARETVVSKNGYFAAHRTLPISLTFNHRAVTGGEATRFLKAFVDYLEAVQTPSGDKAS